MTPEYMASLFLWCSSP